MRTNLLMRVVKWLRVGYPDGVPQDDYVAIFGILHRDLTASEIEQVVRTLREDPAYPSTSSQVPEPQIRTVITTLIRERASDHDVARVRARLVESLPVTNEDDPRPAGGADGLGGPEGEPTSAAS